MSVARWLDERRPAMPPELRRAVDAALEGSVSAGDVSLADRLAGAGLAALSRVAGAVPERSTATELLAADTLLTYACEAAAEAGPDALEGLTLRLDYARFARILEPLS